MNQKELLMRAHKEKSVKAKKGVLSPPAEGREEIGLRARSYEDSLVLIPLLYYIHR